MAIKKVSATADPIMGVQRNTPESAPVEPQENELILPSEPRKLFKEGAEYEVFLNEPVQVMIFPIASADDTTRLVTITVNGKPYRFLRGQWRTVPRFVVEALATTKREAWSFSYSKATDGTTVQHDSSMQHLAYQFDMRDANPKGVAWLQWLLERNL